MALKNSSGNYLKITKVSLDSSNVFYDLYQSQESRLNGLGEFETKKEEYFPVAADLSVLADGERTIKENIITAGYTALKAHEAFSDWVDA